MKHRNSLASLFILAAIPVAALAAEPAPAPPSTPPVSGAETAPGATTSKQQTPPLFEQLDTNHDGYVNKTEGKRSADITARFKALDGDHDWKISVTEYNKGVEATL